MGVAFQWADHPPKTAIAAMASLPKQFRAWFSVEADKRAHARKVLREGLTRSGFFLVGLLLAWLWMMLIGRSVTNRCWLPGPLLQLRHRDGSHKVIDVRLSGRYNGSRLVPFNATLEAARRNRLSEPASKSGLIVRKQRSLLKATPASESGRGGFEALGKEPPGGGKKLGFLESRLHEPGLHSNEPLEPRRFATLEQESNGRFGNGDGEVQRGSKASSGVSFGKDGRKPVGPEMNGQDAATPWETRLEAKTGDETRIEGMDAVGDSTGRVPSNEVGDNSEGAFTAEGSDGVAVTMGIEQLRTSDRKVDRDRTLEVWRLDRTATENFDDNVALEGHLTEGSYRELERGVEGHRILEKLPDRQRAGEISRDERSVLEGPASIRVGGGDGSKRRNSEASGGFLVNDERSLEASEEGTGGLASNRASAAEKPGAKSSMRFGEGGNGPKTETVALGPAAVMQLVAGRELQTEGLETRSQGVTDVVTLGKDGNALTLVTRPHPKTRLRNLVFGIAATAATWSERKEILRLWWDPDRLRGYVWMDTPDLSKDNCTKGAVTARDPMAKASFFWEAHLSGALRQLVNRTCGTGKKIDYSWMEAPDPGLPPVVYSANFSQFAYTHPTGLRSAIRVARVAVEMYRENHEADVLWYVMGDDDTVFCPPNLASVLSKYDPRELVYLGAPSESHLQNVEFSNEMGYGGGGFALSVALAKRLSEIFDGCLHRYPEVYGSDARVQACLAELGVHMRKERGFHQYDLLGNMAGALEAHPVVPFLSMHHVAVFQPVFPRKSAMAGLAQLTRTMKRHPREFLQQTMCLNQAQKFSISIAWGYSVRWYPEFIRSTDLERPQRTFRAWNRGREPFDFDLDTRNTPVTICRLPSLFHASGASSRWEVGKLMLETRYTRTVTDWAEEGSSEDGSVRSSRLRKVSKACPEGEVHVPQREVTEVRVVAPPLSDGWVLAPRRQCCQSVEVVDEKTVEIKIDVCGEGQLIG